jgi:hypothetical protein
MLQSETEVLSILDSWQEAAKVVQAETQDMINSKTMECVNFYSQQDNRLVFRKCSISTLHAPEPSSV